MRKRILCLILAVILTISGSAPAFALEPDPENPEIAADIEALYDELPAAEEVEEEVPDKETPAGGAQAEDVPAGETAPKGILTRMLGSTTPQCTVTFIYGDPACKRELKLQTDQPITQEILNNMTLLCPDPYHTPIGWYKDQNFIQSWNCEIDEPYDGLILYAEMDYTTKGILKLGEGIYYKTPNFFNGFTPYVESEALGGVPGGFSEDVDPVERLESESGMEVYGATINGSNYVKFYLSGGQLAKIRYSCLFDERNGDYTPCWYIDYDENGGTPIYSYSGYEGCLVYDGETATELPTEGLPYRTGYVFKNWYTEKTGGEPYDFSAKVYANDTIYAHWQSEVNYDANYSIDGKPVGVLFTERVDEGGSPTLPIPEDRTGYLFNGWYTDSRCQNRADSSMIIAGETTVYAGWTPISCDVTFNSNGHGTAPAPVTAAYDSGLTDPGSLQDDEYAFGGWYKDASCTDKWDFAKDVVRGSMTLYAKWYAPCTVSFCVDKEELTAVTIKYGSRITEPTVPDNAGYTVEGWYKDEALTRLWEFSQFSVEENMTLYARFHPDCRIEFVTAHGTAPASYTVKYGAKVTKPADLPDEGNFFFIGWYSDPGFTKAWDFDNDTAPESSLRLYAGWGENTSVDLDPQNGQSVLRLDAVVGEKLNRSLIPDYTNGGLLLAGWYTDKAFTHRFDLESDTVTAGLTLYAKWAEPVTVTFNYGNGVTEQIKIGKDEIILRSLLDNMAAIHPDENGWMVIDGWCTDAALTNWVRPDTDKATEGLVLYADWIYTLKGILHLGEGRYYKTQNFFAGLTAHVEDESLELVPSGYAISVGPVEKRDPKSGMDVYSAPAGGADYVEFYVSEGQLLQVFYYRSYGFEGGGYYTPCWYIEYDGNGGYPLVEYSGSAIYDGEKAEMPPQEGIPKWDGHTFVCYCTDQACTTPYDWDTPVHGNLTLYAKWKGELTVKFDMQGHGTAPANIKVQSGAGIILPDTPTADKYRFLGWYKDAACTTLWNESTPILANTTIYAGWDVIRLESISVTAAPVKTAYYVEDTFDDTGMVITAAYSDGSTKAVTGYTVTPNRALTLTDTAMTISYTEDGVTKTAQQAVTVEIETMPFRVIAHLIDGTVYQMQGGEERYYSVKGNSSGTVYYASIRTDSDDNWKSMTSIYPEDLLKKKNDLEWTYTTGSERTYTFTLNSDRTAVTSVTLDGFADPNSDRNGIYTPYVHTHNWAEWENNETCHWKECVQELDFMACPITENTQKNRYGEHTGMEDGVCDLCGYKAPITLTKIEITTAPVKTVYTVGESFDGTGMVVTAAYSDGSTKIVTDYTVTPDGALTTTDTAVTVSYTEGSETNTAMQTITVNPVPVTLTKIEITTAPTKTVYTEGESFDGTGMVVTATYSDNSTKTVTDYTVTPDGALTAADTFVTLSYTEGSETKTAEQVITVEPVPVTLTKIEITTAPAKTSYAVGESFDGTGMVVTATYSDGSTKIVTDYTVTPDGALTAADTFVTASYTEGGETKTAEQVITVEPVPVTLTKIEITTAPAKTVYTVGERFDDTGMVITATYSDGSSKTVSGYTVSPSGVLALTDTSVTVSFTEGSETKTAEQAITVDPVPVIYTIIEGANSTWTEGSTGGLHIRSDAPFAKFDSVQVDGSTIAATNYTAVEGSTRITLAPAYLEKLKIGNHSIEIVSIDGSASTNFTVKAAYSPDPITPKTGDNSHVFFWTALLFISGGALVGITVYVRRKKYNAE